MYKRIIRPILFLFDPESVHYFSFTAIGLLHRIPFMGVLIKALYGSKKPSLKKVAVKKVVAKKTIAKKTTAKKTVAKKVTAKKTVAKKTTVKKATAKKD